MTAGPVPTSPLTDLYNNTTPFTTASSSAMDAAIQAIVATINDNWTTYFNAQQAATLPNPDGSVTTSKLRDGAVTTAKIADLAVTAAKIAVGAIGADQLDPALLANITDIAINAKFAEINANLLQRGINVASPPYNAPNNGTVDAYSVISSILTTIGSTPTTLVFPYGTYRLSSNIVFPPTVELLFMNGAKLSPDNTKTVTINGVITSSLQQIFTGEGTIIGNPLIPMIYGEWFGIPMTTASDGSVSLQKAISFTQQTKIPLTLPKDARIRIDTQVVIEHGKNAGADPSKSITLYGNGAVLYPNLGTYALFVKPLCSTANVGLGYAVAEVNIFNLNFDNLYAVSGSGALQIGRGGYRIDGFSKNQFGDLFMTGFLNSPLMIESARMMKFDSIITRNGAGVLIQCLNLNEFCGDMEFESCEFSGSNASKPINLVGYTASGSNRPEVRGIRFTNCVIYGSGTYINASTNCIIGDIWFQNCSWDVGAAGENALTFSSNGSSTISQVIIDNPYIVNFTGHAIFAQTDSASQIEHFHINGGHIGMIDAPGSLGAIRLVAVEHAMINGVSMTSITGTNAIDIEGSDHVSIIGNSVKSSTITYAIGVSAGSTNYIVSLNIGKGGVNDLGGAVTKVVANNIALP